MNNCLLVRSTRVALTVSLLCLPGAPAPTQDGGGSVAEAIDRASSEAATAISESGAAETPARVPTANAEVVEAAKALLDGMGANGLYTIPSAGLMTEIVIRDGSTLTADDIALFGRLTHLENLQILNYRELDDETAAKLAGLKNLKALALTNSVIGDPTVEMIAEAFPDLTFLDLSSNTNMSSNVIKIISKLRKLERLLLLQNRINDLGTSRLSRLKELRLLDLRGNMEVGDSSMETIAGLPKLAALKHRSTTVTDAGVACLAANAALKALLMQDFAITSQAGQSLAQLPNLQELEIFRCQSFGSEGVLPLKGAKLTRLTLRDLPMVDDQAMGLFSDLPKLRRLYLHELPSPSDQGLHNLGALKSLELLDIWLVPQMTDATVDAIAALPNLKELSIRETGVTDAAVDKILAMPKLQSLTFKDNGSVTDEGLKKLAGKKWTKLDTGQ